MPFGEQMSQIHRASDLESILDREAKVPICKVEEPLEVQEVGDSSRVDGRLSDASMEGTVVPNIASLDVDPANHLDRTSEGNMREDWRVLEVSSLSKNWSNEEEAGIVNRLDDSHLGADGLKEVFVPVNEVLEGIGEIASLGVLFASDCGVCWEELLFRNNSCGVFVVILTCCGLKRVGDVLLCPKIDELDNYCRDDLKSQGVVDKKKVLQGELWKLSRYSESI
ncbi:hypothetical protein V6N13_061937 [Hibiscus sabdariffa]